MGVGVPAVVVAPGVPLARLALGVLPPLPRATRVARRPVQPMLPRGRVREVRGPVERVRVVDRHVGRSRQVVVRDLRGVAQPGYAEGPAAGEVRDAPVSVRQSDLRGTVGGEGGTTGLRSPLNRAQVASSVTVRSPCPDKGHLVLCSRVSGQDLRPPSVCSRVLE